MIICEFFIQSKVCSCLFEIMCAAVLLSCGYGCATAGLYGYLAVWLWGKAVATAVATAAAFCCDAEVAGCCCLPSYFTSTELVPILSAAHAAASCFELS